jgi:hypothetical protein
MQIEKSISNGADVGSNASICTIILRNGEKQQKQFTLV